MLYLAVFMKHKYYIDLLAVLGVLVTPFLFTGTAASIAILIFLSWGIARLLHRLS